MAAVRWMALALAGVAMAGCEYSIPKPTYALVQTPAPYRTGQDGVRIDNAGVPLDQAGYRLDKKGQRAGIIDTEAKRLNQTSNPMSGYYISSQGAVATGSVMAPSEGAGAGVGKGPGSANPMPSGTMDTTPRLQPPPQQ